MTIIPTCYLVNSSCESFIKNVTSLHNHLAFVSIGNKFRDVKKNK